MGDSLLLSFFIFIHCPVIEIMFKQRHCLYQFFDSIVTIIIRHKRISCECFFYNYTIAMLIIKDITYVVALDGNRKRKYL